MRTLLLRFLRHLRLRADRGRREADLSDEIESHLALRAADLMASGIGAAEARRRATLEFGGVERYRAHVRDVQGWLDVGHGAARDLLIAWRRLKAAPLYALFAVSTLGLGVGITTAIYTVVHHGLASPGGLRKPDGLTTLRQGRREVGVSFPDFRDLVEQHRHQRLAAHAIVATSLGLADRAVLTIGEAVTGDYFEVLGVRASLGRLLGPIDDEPGSPSLVVLSSTTWRTSFTADPNVIGRTIQVGGMPFTVVGVADPAFRGVASGITFYPTGFWISTSAGGRIPGHSGRSLSDAGRRDRTPLRVIGRLRDGVSSDDATEDLMTIGRRLDALYPPGATRPEPGARVRAWTAGPLFSAPLAESTNARRVILGLPALVFLIACTNLANLSMSRGLWRRSSIAVRRTLGATRSRLIREEMSESILLAAAGGLLGLLVAKVLLWAGLRAVEPSLTALAPLVQVDLPLSAPVLAAAVAATLLSLIVGGLMPAAWLTRTNLRQMLAGGTGHTTARWRGRGNLIALQVAASVGLFLVAFSATRVLTDLRIHEGPGLDGVAVATVPFDVQYDRDRAMSTVAAVTNELARTAGIRRAAAAAGLPGLSSVLPPSFTRIAVTTPEEPAVDERTRHPSLVVGTPDVFEILGLRPIAGRTFTTTDLAGSAPVAVVNRDLALDLFGTTDAVGRTLVARVTSPLLASERMVTLAVVGVVPVLRPDPKGGRRPEIYLPLAQQYDPSIALLATSSPGETVPVAELQTAIRRSAPGLAVVFSGDGTRLSDAPRILARVMITVAQGLAALALLLAMSGLYGVLSDVVTRRTREMGLRIALGADRGDILRLVFKGGLRPVLEGLAIGLGVALVIRQILRATMVNTLSAIDPVAFSVATALLLAAGAVACYVPARRASRVDPNVALRDL